MTRTKRTPLRERILPDYTHGEELMNMITHIVGGAAGLLILIGSILIGAKHRDPWAIVSGSVYGVLTCALFVISSVYHGLPDGMGKRVMQVLDHCTIYFMIAGTYTPVLLVGIRKISPAAAWIVFGIEWGCAAAAATLTAIDLKKYKRMSMICYLAMGWAIVAILRPTVTVMTTVGRCGAVRARQEAPVYAQHLSSVRKFRQHFAGRRDPALCALSTAFFLTKNRPLGDAVGFRLFCFYFSLRRKRYGDLIHRFIAAVIDREACAEQIGQSAQHIWRIKKCHR